jgi:hypothetical protein
MIPTSRKGVRRGKEIELTDVSLSSQTTFTDTISLLGKEDKIAPSTPIYKRASKALIALIFATAAVLVTFGVRHFLPTSVSKRAGSISQLFENTVTKSNLPYAVRGRFQLNNCQNLDLKVIANFDGTKEETRVEPDCTFQVDQWPESKLIGYTFNGQTNVIDLENYLFRRAQDSSVNLGVIPVIYSHDNFVKSKVHIRDIQSGKPISSFNIKITANLHKNEVLSLDGTEGEAFIHLKGGYYTAFVTADGYRPAQISFSDLLSKRDITVYLVDATQPSQMIDLKSKSSQKLALKVKFYNKNAKETCFTTAFSNCPGSKFFRNFDNKNSEVRDFILYEEMPNVIMTPVVGKRSTSRGRRVLEDYQEVAPGTLTETNTSDETVQVPTGVDQEVIQYELENGTYVNVTANETAVIGVSAPVPGKEERCKNDWTSKECVVEVTSEKEVDISTKMSNYLVFSPNITCIRPTVLARQQMTITKVAGDGYAFWFVIKYNETDFIIVTDLTNNPATIIHPDGVVVNILSRKARSVAQNRDIFASITLPDGKYFNFDDDFWIKMANVPVTEFTGKIPRINFQSSNALDLTENAFGNHLKRAVIELIEKDEVEALYKLNAEKGTSISGQIYSSNRGYKIVEIDSQIHKQKNDKYRVCIYCLKREAKRIKFQTIAQGKSYKFGTILYKDFLTNKKLLEEFVYQTLHSAPQNTYVDESHARYENAYARSQLSKTKTFTHDDLLKIFEQQENGKLKNVWFKPTTDKRLASTKFNAYNILKDEKNFIFNVAVASSYLSEEAEVYEPELAPLVSNAVDSTDHGYKGLYYPKHILRQIYNTGKDYKCLFIKATKTYADQAWPYVLARSDGVINKYFLNLGEVRVALGMSRIPGTEDRSTCDARTEPLLRKYLSLTTDDENQDYSKNPYVVNINKKTVTLTEECVKFMYNLNLPGLFTPTQAANYRLRENKFYYRHEGKLYIYKFDALKQPFLQGEIKDTATNMTIQKCLEMDQTSTDSNEYRFIIINATDIFAGYCHGTFYNATKCEGTFLGQHRGKCQNYKNCEFLGTEFQCEGETTKEGCKGTYTQKTEIHQKIHKLETSTPYDIVDSRVPGDTKISYTGDDLVDQIRCQSGYDKSARVCTQAEMNYELVNLGPNRSIKGTATCKGGFQLEGLDCYEGPFFMEECDSQSVTAPGTCNGTYHLRDCQNGGSMEGCNDRVERDRVIDCVMGYWDGQTCNVPPLYIIIDEKKYYSGVCDGDYVENTHCRGSLVGLLIECSETVTPNTLCKNQPTYQFVCNGTTTKDGCQGEFFFDTSFRGHNFKAYMTTDNTPVSTNKSHPHSMTLFQFSRPEGENRIVSINVACRQSYSDSDKLCGDAIYDEISYDGDFTRKLHVECRGVMNLNDLSCDHNNYLISDCTTKYSFNEYPICNGTFKGLRCVDGGSIDNGCNGNQIANQKLLCEGGMWNGKSCKKRPVHIILNNAAYITGTCDGKYVENEYCEGTMNALIYVCPIDLSSDTLCYGPTVDKFICIGKLTKYGCDGKYIGGIKLRNAKLKLETPDSSTTTIYKVVNDKAVTLRYDGVNPDYKVRTYGWSNVNSDCGKGYADPDKTCTDAKVDGTQNWISGNNTYFKAECEGPYNLMTLVCKERAYHAVHCNTTQPYVDGRCNGTFTELRCKNGGNMHRCFGTEEPELFTYCNGTYQDGHCEPFLPPKMSIIRVNDTHWLKGICSSAIEQNACVGTFTEGLFVYCNGDPVNIKEDFDACTKIPNESFGSCEGKTNEEGCRGIYTHPIILEGVKLNSANKKDNDEELVYNFQTYLKPIDIDISSDEAITDIHCETGFSPKALLCPEANVYFFKENADIDLPALELKTVSTCKGASMDLNNYSCSGDFVFNYCLGRAHIEGEGVFRCLGDYIKNICPAGGSKSGCVHPDVQNIHTECLNNYWDGVICGKDKPTFTSEIRITELPPTTVKDIVGRDVLIGNFEVESFTMVSAFSSFTRLEGNVIKSCSLKSAQRTEDGSLKNIKLYDIDYPLSFDEGLMTKMTFLNFTLDELNYPDFATNDKFKLIKVTFKEFNIKDTMFYDMQTKNSVIRTLKYGSEQAQDYGIDDLPISLAYGYVNIRNAEVYLPYISNSTIKRLMQGDKQQKVTIIVPKIVGINVPDYRIHFRPSTGSSDSNIYIEFPEFDIENLSVNLFMMQDVILTSKNINTKPSVVQQVLQNYEQDARLADVPDMPAGGS